MSWIEGIGDEVTVFLVILLLLLVTGLAWLSTNVPDLGGIRIIILDHTNFHRLGEIARRYQIIGYQIISGQRARGNEEPEVEPPSQEAENTDDNVEASAASIEARPDRDLSPPHALDEPETTATADDAATGARNEAASEEEEDVTTPKQSSEVHTEHSERATNKAASEEVIEPAGDEGSGVSQSRDEGLGVSQSRDEGLGVSQSTDDISQLRRRRISFFKKSSDCTESSLEDDATRASDAAPIIDIPDVGAPPFSTFISPADDVDSTSGSESVEVPLAEGSIRVKIKYLDDRQRQVQAKPDETIGEFKRKHFAGELAENMLVRFIHNGRELRQEASTLQSCNIIDGAVIHCLLTRSSQPEEPSHSDSQDSELNLGAFMVPLFGLILGIIWYCRFAYRTFFTAMSTVSLMGVSFLYAIAVVAIYRNDDDHIRTRVN